MTATVEAGGTAANPGRASPVRRGASPAVAAAALLLLLGACGGDAGDARRVGVSGLAVGSGTAAPATPSGTQAGQAGFVRGFLGGVAAEEPRAALVARLILSGGGTAVDAAVAAGFTLAATLPSRAALGGGGACVVFNPARAAAEAVVFPAGGREAVPPGADRPAAVPQLARGLFALHTRGGRRPFEELLVPAEEAARLGLEVSRPLAEDLAAVAGPLLADPWSAAVFGPAGRPLAAGERLVQTDLGATLATLRTAGVGDLHQGALARRLEEASAAAGGALTVGELRAAVPRFAPPLQLRTGDAIVSFLPPPADGGLAAASAFLAVAGGASPEAAARRGVAVAQAWRERGGEAQALVAAEVPAPPAWPALPASTALVVHDRDGMAVACAFSMNNLFGTGRIAPGTGILLAAAPGIGQVQPPLLAAAVAHRADGRAFRAAAAGSGQEMAPMGVAVPLAEMLRGGDAVAALAGVPQPGRGVALSCPRHLPGNAEACSAAADPRGGGLAIGGAGR